MYIVIYILIRKDGYNMLLNLVNNTFRTLFKKLNNRKQ